MATNRVIRRFFTSGVISLLVLMVLFEAVTWSVGSEAKLNHVHETGGLFSYLGLLVRNTLLPELVTVFILVLLVLPIHRWVSAKRVDTIWSLLRYQFSFLPVLLIAFVIFIPFTQSVRYVLVEFPHYSLAAYRREYLVASYSLELYRQYLFPVLFIGYSILTISLVTGSLSNQPLIEHQ